ncbi:A disintegrin and metalloproteinase with thrombospondin motifs 19 [Rhinatrema bivittatum]|uniref:A disintegrin and metalloproteinase with thrombospondin motifs 19 n=1 Tax=Rhinatrema bivittatum TaxID=194408 RepID=UPI001126C2BB|nr:A disintegrin and metalloproteinase with thrombospondin motifs 19 [Rhinatrema bivittatum]
MRLSSICYLFHLLCFLTNEIIPGLQVSLEEEEWEIVYPALWGSELEHLGSEDPIVFKTSNSTCGDSSDCVLLGSTGAGSSREARSVFSHSAFPAGGHRQEKEDEYESQEIYHWSPLPQRHGGTLTTSSSSISSYATAAASTAAFPSASSSPDIPPSLTPDGKEEVRLRISAFGGEFYLLLRQDSRFLSEGFVVEERLRAGKYSVEPEKSCYYSGTVLYHPESSASFSTCGGGLLGFIQINDDFIFIEPLNQTLAVKGHAHRVYRRKRSSEDKTVKKQTSRSQYCGVVTEKKKYKTQRVSETGRGKRYSYKLSKEYNIETVVVADPAMVSYHGPGAARRFILTILNMVFNLFQHKSLGVQMNLRVTKLVLLHETPTDMYIGHHGEKMLESFCKWQHEEFGKKNDIHLEISKSWGDDMPSVDAAILITRKDFCVHKDEPCDTVGIAYLSGMCSEKRKCTIAEDSGLNLAFTIAHEMGHNMGINHDNDHPSCADGVHIMSGEWIKGQNLGDVSWSRCSREDLERFLRSKASNCLLQTSPQSLSSMVIPFKLPGMTYTADEQCQILFGPKSSFCQEMQHVMCTGLWCKIEGEKECKTKLEPPMDGTECDPGKHCKVGECTSKTSYPQYLLGEWSEWSACSRTCGSGINSRQRKCSGPDLEGRDCLGPSIQYQICKNPLCPAGVPGFRDWQCQIFGIRRPYQKPVVQWEAIIDEEKPCALLCSPVGKDQPVLLAEKVMDGTSCGVHGLDICTNGRCQKVGCDGVLGSLSREDHCGVCNGNGKSCRIIKGDFNHTRGAGYVEALVIPAGARRIKVVEEKPAHSYLALRDAGMQSINNDWKIEHPGTFSMAGTTVHYVRRGLWEKISAKGPTTSPLHLLVLLFHDQNYGLHYEYTVPLDPVPENQSSKLNEALFMWTHSGWEDCDTVCGGGERKTIVSCTKIMNKNISTVDNKKCKDLTKPEPQIRKCNEQPCQTRWMMTEWTPCSRTCGKGNQNRQVACTQQLRNGTLIRAREKDCPAPKPTSAQRCEGQDCMTVWEAGVWSECSLKCGKGVRHRTVKCTNPHKKCILSTRPKEMEDCEDYSKCYIWRMGDWSKCSVTCGKGMQSRVIQCMHKITGRHGNECFPSEKPAAYRPCNLQTCNEKSNVNKITSPRLAALTFKCLQDQWPIYCKVLREKNLCQDMRWYQRCCETCRDFYAQKMQQKS